MKISTIRINKFKRFSDLTITDIPESAKLIVLVGPNGCGKTSIFEALNQWYKLTGFGNIGEKDYIEKKGTQEYFDPNWYSNKVSIQFFNGEVLNQDQVKSKFYFRTAYRNEPDFNITNLSKQSDPTQKIKLPTLMQNDQTVSENYQRLISSTLAGVFDSNKNDMTVKGLREELIGKIKTSLSRIFQDLQLSSIGDPLSNGSFYFEKGSSKDFHYKNLSAGEKSVFDLVLDMIIKSTFYSDGIFCIDEPEAHMHTRLQGKVLKELFNLTPSSSQLWIATHSIGMLKEAEDIEQSNPGSVVFLDFDNRDYDETEIIKPSRINKAIWDRFFDLAFGDFAKLIAPNRIVFCEGTSQGRKYKDFDAQIYERIFGSKYPDTKFVSIGSSSELENIENQSIKIVSNILKTSELIKFVDRDDRSQSEIDDLLKSGIKTSKRRHIESYLLDDELIIKLCKQVGKDHEIDPCIASKANAIKNSTRRGHPNDDIKSASGEIFTELKRILGLTQCGNNKCAFLRDTMAPLITEETNIYKEIESELFS